MAFISIYLGFAPTGRLNSSGWMLLVRCLYLSPSEPRKLSFSMVFLEIGWWPPSGMEFSRGNANLIAPVYDSVSVSPRQGFFLLSHQRATAFQIVDHPWEQVNDVQSSYLFYKVTLFITFWLYSKLYSVTLFSVSCDMTIIITSVNIQSPLYVDGA